MLIVRDLAGNIEPIVDYDVPKREWILNGEHTLKFGIYESENNAPSFDMLQSEVIVECEDDYFRIKQLDNRLEGGNRYKDIACLHVISDLEFTRVYPTTNGTLTINQAMDKLTAGTPFTYEILGTFDSVAFSDFGNGKDGMELFAAILEQFQAEYDVKKHHITLKNRVGADKDFQFRYKHNITNLGESYDSNDLRTVIQGTGKKDANGVPLVSVTYRSPNADIYGERHADLVSDERFTSAASLTDYVKTKLQDTPLIAISFDYNTLYNEIKQDIEKGDAGYLIHEALGIEFYARVVKILDYPGIKKDPVITIGNVLLNGTQEIVRRGN